MTQIEKAIQDSIKALKACQEIADSVNRIAEEVSTILKTACTAGAVGTPNLGKPGKP